MRIEEIKNIKTGSKALDWMTAQGQLKDYSDDELVVFEVIFEGTLKPNMVNDVRAATNSNGSLILEDNEQRTVMVSAVFGKYNSTRNKVHYRLSYTEVRNVVQTSVEEEEEFADIALPADGPIDRQIPRLISALRNIQAHQQEV